jgi:malonate transporter and related proteins
MTNILLGALVPIFAVMGLGYFAGWIRDVDNHHVAGLNALVMDFAVPAALFVTTASTARSMLITQWPLLLALLVPMFVLYALSYWMERRVFGMPPASASVQALTIAFPNFAAAGLPLIAAVFGGSQIIDVALGIALGAIFLSPLTLGVLEVTKSAAAGAVGRGVILQAVGRSLLKPVVLAPIIGIAFSLAGIRLPDFVGHAFQLIGQASGGVALFLTGLILSSQRLLVSRNVIISTILKNIAQPLVCLGLIVSLSMTHDTARATLLLMALPSGFFGVLFGLRYGVESQEVGSTLIVSSLFSVVTLAITLIFTASR